MKNLIFLILFLVFSNSLIAQQSNNQIKKWRSDLLSLHDQLKKRHIDLYHSTSKDRLDSAFTLLNNEIPELENNQILVRIAQIVSMVGDGHTSFFPGNQKKMWFNFLPIKFWYFPDGIRVITASVNHKSLLGKKLVRVGNTSIDEVVRKISTTIGADNEMEYKYTVPFEIIRPELLHALNIIENPDSVTFQFADHSEVTFNPIKLKEWQNLDWISANGIYEDGKSPSQRMNFHFASNLTINHLKERKYYWYSYLENNDAVFFQYNICWNQKDRPSFASMAKEMLSEFDERQAKKLIIDLRQNSGGEPLTAKYLLEALASREDLLNQNQVYVLVGRRTFSAALTNAIQLRKLGAIIVGEPSRGKPNNPSEGRNIDLKSLKLWSTVSTQFVERDSDLGDSPFIPIDIPIELTYSDYKNGVDTVIEYVLAL